MADLNAKQAAGRRRAGIFPDSQFAYDPASDTYRCPAGQTLSAARHHAKRRATDYATARGVCDACPLRAQCTRSKSGRRSVKRHDRQQAIDRARQQAASPAARRDRRRRQHLMERSFADASDNHGLKRSRWRGLWRQRVQDLMIAAVQNVRILTRNGKGPKPAAPAANGPTAPFSPPPARRPHPRRRPTARPVWRARSNGCPRKSAAARAGRSGRLCGNGNRFGQHAVNS